MSRIMRSELERLARVAVGHGRDDPAVDVFFTFVGSLDPLPSTSVLRPAAQRIGKMRLAQALDRPGETRLGACRLLAAACADVPRPTAASSSQPVLERPEHDAIEGGPELSGSDGLMSRAIRAGLNLFA
jgi:hypothetical protein